MGLPTTKKGLKDILLILSLLGGTTFIETRGLRVSTFISLPWRTRDLLRRRVSST